MGDEDNKQIQKRDSFLRKISNTIDNNLQIIKAGLYTSAFVTLIWMSRQLHIGSRFLSAAEIPTEYFVRNVKLRGRVKGIEEKSAIIDMQHRPIISWIGKSNDKTLQVKLGGVRMTESGYSWLNTHLKDRVVWFRLFNLPTTESGRYSIRRNINLYLVSQGLAKVNSETELSGCFLYNEFIKKLREAEASAKARGKGDWPRVTNWQRLKNKLWSTKQ